MTDATFVAGPTLNGLSLVVEKPDFFIVEYNIPKKDVRFQFMNTVRIGEKPLNLSYIHSRADNRTMVDGSISIDPANKLSANYMVGTRNCKTFLIWKILFSIIFLGRRYRVNQIFGCILVAFGVIVSVASWSQHPLISLACWSFHALEARANTH